MCLNLKNFTQLAAFSRKLNAYLAEFSYSIYAFHTPFIFLSCAVLSKLHIGNEFVEVAGVLILLLTIIAAKSLSTITENKRLFYRDKADRVMIWLHL